MPYPQMRAGLRVTGTLLESLQPIDRMVASDVANTDNSVMTDLTDLAFDVEGGGVYQVECSLHVFGHADNDGQTAWSVPASSTGLRSCVGMVSSSSDGDSTLMRTRAHGWETVVQYGLESVSLAVVYHEFGALVAGTDGTVVPQFSRVNNTQAGVATTVRAQSYLRAWRVG